MSVSVVVHEGPQQKSHLHPRNTCFEFELSGQTDSRLSRLRFFQFALLEKFVNFDDGAWRDVSETCDSPEGSVDDESVKQSIGKTAVDTERFWIIR